MKIEQIPPSFICQVWPSVSAMIGRSLDYESREFSVEQLQFALVRGEQVLFLVRDETCNVIGAIAATFENFPAKRIAFVTAVVGKAIATEEVFNQLAEWAIDNGCTHIRGAASPSAARLWQQKLGFSQQYILVEKAL